MTGKEKCAHLRQLRERIAREHNIPYTPTPCTYQGDDCTGTCPKCEEELRQLTQAIDSKKIAGEPIRHSDVEAMKNAHPPLPEDLLDEFTLELPDDEEDLLGLVSFEEDEPEVPSGNQNTHFIGQSLTACPNCGLVQPMENQFCRKCGSSMQSILHPDWGIPEPAPEHPIQVQLDSIRERVTQLIKNGNPEQLLQVSRGLEEVNRWLHSMTIQEDFRQLQDWKRMHTPGVMVSNEELQKRKKRKGWFR